MVKKTKVDKILTLLSADELVELQERLKRMDNPYTDQGKLPSTSTSVFQDESDPGMYSATRLIRSTDDSEIVYKSIIDVLISDKSINGGNYDFRATEIFQCRKELLLYDILSYRGYRDNAMGELQALKLRLEKIEAYDLLCLVYDRIIKYLGFYGSISEIATARKVKDSYEKKAKALERAIELYLTNIATQIPDGALVDHNLYYTKVTDEIGDLQKKTKSKQLLYYLRMIEFMYYDLNKDYVKCESIVVEIQKLLRQNKFIFSNARAHQNLLNGAYCLIKQYKFSKALVYINNSRKYSPSLINNIIGRNLEAIGKLQSGFSPAVILDEMEMIYSSLNERTPDFLKLQLHSLKAYCEFLMSDHRSSLRTLEKGLSTSQDKEGWYHYLLILRIMNLISLELFDEADFEIENFRKKIERRKSLTFNYQRLVLTKRMLVVLSKSSYRFEKVKKTIQRIIYELSNIPENQWSPGSAEIIPVDLWLRSRINSEPFDLEKAVVDYKERYESIQRISNRD